MKKFFLTFVILSFVLSSLPTIADCTTNYTIHYIEAIDDVSLALSNYACGRILLKFNTTLPSNYTYQNSNLSLVVSYADVNFDGLVMYRINNQTWTSNDTLSDLWGLSKFNQTTITGVSFYPTGFKSFDVSNLVSDDIISGSNNSLWLETGGSHYTACTPDTTFPTSTMLYFGGQPGDYNFWQQRLTSIEYHSGLYKPKLAINVSYDICDNVSICEMKTDYDSEISCSQSNVVVKNDEELDSYLLDYGFDGVKYQNLKISYDIINESIEIHSPCKITLKDNIVLNGSSVCLDGRNGIIDDNGYTVNANNVTLLSELDDVHFGQGSTINANELYMGALKTVKIGENSDVNISGPIRMISTGEFSSSDVAIKQNSHVTSESLYMESTRTTSVGSSVIIEVANNMTIKSIGTSTGSEAWIKQDAEINAGNLDIVSENKATLGKNTLVNIIGNFNMNAVTPNKCTVYNSATINASTLSGNCLI